MQNVQIETKTSTVRLDHFQTLDRQDTPLILQLFDAHCVPGLIHELARQIADGWAGVGIR